MTPEHFPEQPAHFMLPGPEGALEVKVHSTERFPSAIGIIAHPNPLQEGTMDNKVVHTVARAMEKQGAATVRFNYRGVGKSEGSFGAVTGECDDFAAVLDWVSATCPDARLWFAGFSFGAYIAAKVAMSHPPERLISIAPAVHLMDYQPLSVDCPWLVIRAMADELVPPEQIAQWLSGKSAIQCIDFPDCSHFFHGQLVKLRETIQDYVGTL